MRKFGKFTLKKAAALALLATPLFGASSISAMASPMKEGMMKEGMMKGGEMMHDKMKGGEMMKKGMMKKGMMRKDAMRKDGKMMKGAMMAVPFGGEADVAFAGKIWSELAKMRIVGPDRINVRPFEGNEPQGAIQQVWGTKITIDGRSARVLVKANHGGKQASVQSVYDNPNKFLGAYTVMFKREAGYDPENRDWFWAKFTPKGDLARNPKGVKLAGRVAKGANKGCIACHSAAGGDDLETLSVK
jgi:hypothetical protein